MWGHHHKLKSSSFLSFPFNFVNQSCNKTPMAPPPPRSFVNIASLFYGDPEFDNAAPSVLSSRLRVYFVPEGAGDKTLFAIVKGPGQAAQNHLSIWR